MGLSGIELVKQERERQINEEGYSATHDSFHDVDEFVKAAISYAIIDLKGSQENYAYAWWPWEGTAWKPKDRLRNLVRSTALLVAAIDRLLKENKS
jgi:hypothetical protein